MVSRRKFFGAIGAIAGGFMILPPATTYQRIWRVRSAAGKIEFPVNFYCADAVGLDEQIRLYSDLIIPDKHVQEPPKSTIFDEGPYKCLLQRPSWKPPAPKKAYEDRLKTLAEILGVS